MFLPDRLTRLQCTVEAPASDLRLVRVTEPVWTHQAQLPVAELSRTGVSRLHVDLSAVQKMSTAALAELLILKHRLSQQGCDVMFQGFQQQPRDLCRVLKLSALLADEAAAAEPPQAPPARLRASTHPRPSGGGQRWTHRSSTHSRRPSAARTTSRA